MINLTNLVEVTTVGKVYMKRITENLMLITVKEIHKLTTLTVTNYRR